MTWLEVWEWHAALSMLSHFLGLEEPPKSFWNFPSLQKNWISNHRTGSVWNTCCQYMPAACNQHCQAWMECELSISANWDCLCLPKPCSWLGKALLGVVLAVVHLSHHFQFSVLLANLVIWPLCEDSCLREGVPVYSFYISTPDQPHWCEE